MVRAVRDTNNVPAAVFEQFLGINDLDDASLIGQRYLPRCKDFDNHTDGRLILRPGQTLVTPGSMHSIWSNRQKTLCLYMQNGNLMQLNPDETSSVIATGFSTTARMRFTEDGDRIFLSNSEIIGQLKDGVYSGSFTEPLDYYKDYPVPGHLILFWKGRLWIAYANILFYSDGLHPWQFDFRHNYILFSEKITLLQGVTDGLWVADGKIHFLSGTDPEGEMPISTKADYNAILYSDALVPGDIVGQEGMADSTFWFESERGVCFVGNSGMFRNVSERKYKNAQGTTGAGLFIGGDGHIQRYITVLNQ